MRLSSGIVFIILFAQIGGILFVTASSDDEWPMFRHDSAHTGHSNSKTPNAPNFCWISERVFAGVGSLPISSLSSAYAVSNGRIFVGSWDGIVCLNESNGFKLWSYSTGEAKKVYHMDSVFSTPCIYEEKLYFISGKGFIFCLNASSGEELWHISPLRPDWVFLEPSNCALIVISGRIFFGTTIPYKGGVVYCLNANTGKEIWNFTHQGAVLSTPTVANGKVFISYHDLRAEHQLRDGDNEAILALDEISGDLFWSARGGGYSSPAYSKGKIIVGSYDTNYVYCLDSETGKVIWEYETEDKILSSPAIYNEAVIIGSDDKYVYCLNLDNGDLIWKYYIGSPIRSSPVVADEKVFIGYGKLINQSFWQSKLCILNETTGSLIWDSTTGIGSWYIEQETCSPIVANGKIFISAMDQKLYCFGPIINNLTIKPTFSDVKGRSLFRQPELWTMLYGNGTIKTISEEIIFNGPMGAYSIVNVVWKGYSVIPRIVQAHPSTISFTFTKSNQSWYPKINCILPTELSLSLDPTVKIGSKIGIEGHLTCNKIGVPNSDILLLYSVTDGVTWYEITQVKTHSDGSYSAVWMPSATGDYMVKAIWKGNESYPGSESICNLAVIPYDDEYTIPVSSNSTISSLIFDSVNREIHFNVDGPSDSIGYAQVTIAKELASNKDELDVYFDGDEIPYELKSSNDSWILIFTYKHSMHEVVVALGRKASGLRIPRFPSESIVVGFAVGILILSLILRRW